MSLEGRVLSSVLNDKDIHVIMQANADELFVTHGDIWEFIKNHYDKYQSIPTPKIVLENHPDFDYEPEAVGTKYHLDALREHYIDSNTRMIVRKAAGLLQDGKSGDALDSMLNDATKLRSVTSHVRDVDAGNVDDAMAYYEKQIELKDRGSLGIYTGLKRFDDCLPSGIMPGHFGVILAYPAIGKAIAFDTPIATPQGWKNVQDIEPGDMVIGSNGHPTEVVAIKDWGKRDVCRVTFSDNTYVDVAPEHEWTVYSRDTWYNSKHTFVKETQELMADMTYARHSDVTRKPLPKWCVPLVEPVQYDHADLPVDPYVLGTLIGDGDMSNEQVVLINPDEFIVNKVSERVDINAHTTLGCPSFGVLNIRKHIVAMGMNVKSDNKFIPHDYMFSSIEQRIDLLNGLFDTDGSCSKSGQASYSTLSEQLSHDVAELIRSLGGIAIECQYDRGNGNINYIVKIRRLGIDPFSLPRKSERYINGNSARWITSIERINDQEQRCIQVSADDHLFVTKDYLVTHNSWLMLYFAIQAWLHGKVPMIVSLEMTEAEVRNRIYTILGHGHFSHRNIASGNIDLEDFKMWHKKTFSGKPPIHIISSDGDFSPNVLKGKIDQYKPDIVFLDYLNLMSSNDNKSDNETVKMKQLSRQLKLLAVSEEIPIVAISSATPDDATDMNSVPTLGQVAWSKQISYDADWLIALGREVNSDIVNVVFRKNRHGELGEFLLRVDFDNGIFTYEGLPDL